MTPGHMSTIIVSVAVSRFWSCGPGRRINGAYHDHEGKTHRLSTGTDSLSWTPRLLAFKDYNARCRIPRSMPRTRRLQVIDRPNQVWCADITCIPVQRGFLYLVAVMDWATRHVLAWRLSNTMDSRFCVEALNEALSRYGSPEIFNTDQGSQFTSYDFTGVLKDAEITISMDGRGRCMDNIFIERLWRSLKYEAVYLHELTDGFVAERVIDEWFNFYNTECPHSSFDGQTLAETYGATRPVGKWSTGCAGLTTSPQVSPVAVSGIPREATQQQQDLINRGLAT